MDPATLHLIVSGLLSAVMAGVGYAIKGLFDKVNKISTDLNKHIVDDAVVQTTLLEQVKNVDKQLDHIIEKLND